MYVEWKLQLRGGFDGIQKRIAHEEKECSLFRIYEPMIVPGLLQTPDYAGAVFQSASRMDRTPLGAEEAVRERMRRQEVLYTHKKRFHFVMGESALRYWRGGREVMLGQVDRLISASRLSNVSIGILPFSACLPYLPLHGFWIKDEDRVVVETVSAELNLGHESEVATYERAFRAVAESARYGRDARVILDRISEDLTS
nr:DUF5753 domain-containing protein [Nocardiopsis mwathae]